MSGDVTEIRVAGSGGQGLILSARMLFYALSLDGKNVSQSQNYEPTSRGGFCYSDLVVAKGAIDYPLITGIDFLLVLDQVGVPGSVPLLRPGALVLTDERLVPEPPEGDFSVHALPFTDQAIALGSHRVANIIGLGAFAALGGFCARESLEQAVRDSAPPKFVDLNIEAMEAGFAAVTERAA